MKGVGTTVALTFIAATLFLVPAAGQAAPMAAKAVQVTGGVSYISFQDRGEYDVKVGTGLAEGDRIKTGPGGFVEIRFDNGNRIQLSENTDMTIRASRTEPGGGFTSIFGLALGKVRSLVSRFAPGSSKFEYHTKTAVAGVAGTDFVTEVPEPDITTVAVLPPGMENEDNPASMQGSAICGRPELQGKSKVYVQGKDDSHTMVYLTSCFMTTVGDRRAPAQPSIIPDDMLFKFRRTFQPGAPAAVSTDLMIANLGKQVSMPIVSSSMNSLLHNLDSTLVHGGKAGMTSGSPAGGGVVTGTVVITIK
ncbi:MAG: FecR domain-containing protein [Nitrospinota bacterium]|nr:FecR domain-containing protein [Nitrospinota bacterium]